MQIHLSHFIDGIGLKLVPTNPTRFLSFIEKYDEKYIANYLVGSAAIKHLDCHLAIKHRLQTMCLLAVKAI